MLKFGRDMYAICDTKINTEETEKMFISKQGGGDSVRTGVHSREGIEGRQRANTANGEQRT